MTTILLNALLCLFIFWVLLLIYYTCSYIRFSRKYDKRQAEIPTAPMMNGKEVNKEENTYTLVGKSKGFTAGDLPKPPVIPKSEFMDNANNTFATEVPTITEEENEMDVAYTMEMVDKETVLREELLISSDLPAEVSPSAILARDLIRLERWRKNDNVLEAEDANEIQQTLHKIQGTVLMDKYAEHLKAQENKHQRFLASIRQAEEANQEQEDEYKDAFAKPAPLEQEAKPLDYYL